MVTLDLLKINVTNKCNMSCKHCSEYIPGEKSKSITPNIINSFFKKCDIGKINELIIGGGEPFLAINEIETIIDSINTNSIKIDGFRIITNCDVKLTDEDFVRLKKIFNKVHAPIDIKVSETVFHREQRSETFKEKFTKFKQFAKENSNITFDLYDLEFEFNKKDDPYSELFGKRPSYELQYSGRAKDLANDKRFIVKHKSVHIIDITNTGSDYFIGGTTILSIYGDVIIGKTIAPEYYDKYKICNVLDSNIDFINLCNKFNERIRKAGGKMIMESKFIKNFNNFIKNI